MDRFIITEDESIQLSEIGDEFCRGLAKLAGEIIARFPEDLETLVIMTLQDCTLLYSSYTADIREKVTEESRKNRIGELND